MHPVISLLADAIALAPIPTPPAPPAPKSLPEVISGIQGWIMGILFAVGSLFLAIGGLRYMTAGGDPAQIEQAKGNFKAALVGYALAVLAPVILGIWRSILVG